MIKELNFKISGFADEINPDFSVQLEFLNKLNVNYMEIRGVNGKNIASLSLDEVKEIKKQLDEAGVKISSVGSPIGKADLDKHEEDFEKFKHVVEIAKILETKYIRMFSFFIPEGKTKEDVQEEVLTHLKTMIDYAKENDVVLLHENEKGIFGDTLESCLYIMENLCCENFKACFDFANFIQCDVETVNAYQKLKPFIEYVHIKDAIGAKVVAPGMGDGELETIIGDILNDGYAGFFSLEPHLTNFFGFAQLENGSDEKEQKANDGKLAWWTALNSFKAIVYNIQN
ncbi:MAG: sugar phosphate isomerase/epimerase family protein [Clostridia bacterium]